PLCREMLAIYEAKSPNHWRAPDSKSMLGGSLLAQKRYAEAEPLMLEGYQGLKQLEDKYPAAVRQELKPALQDFIQLYTETGRSEKAAVWKQRLEELVKLTAPPATAQTKAE